MFGNALLHLDTQAALTRLSEFSGPSGPRPAISLDRPVLLVDDDPDVPPLVDAALRPFDFGVEAVGRGVEALERLRVRPYDLVVLDLAMGDVHGFEVLRALREFPMNSRVPVLVLTADGSHEALARSFGLGADEFVKKPFDLRELGMRAFRLIQPS
jgi:DNA-binding response OmpR family regulator